VEAHVQRLAGPFDLTMHRSREGYGAAASDRSLRRRLQLYQLSYALEHLWWLEDFADKAGVARVQERIRAILADDSTAGSAEPPPAARG
jgi:hypothetical protein